jgi:dTDP-4-amino-4,6-dideoxygalactose transaminase
MNTIMDIANKYNIFVVEDAAQAMMSSYQGKLLGTIGHFGTFSFHETKNYTSAGEGGLLIINDENFINRAEIIREKGTNRSLFFRGVVDKYSWVDLGSSYLMNDVSAAYLWGQLEKVNEINNDRLNNWKYYYKKLQDLENKGFITLPVITKNSTHNAHIFYIKVASLKERTSLIDYLKRNGVTSVFHYLPLHSSPAGLNFSTFNGKDKFTTSDSEKLIRLPLFYKLDVIHVEHVIKILYCYFGVKND